MQGNGGPVAVVTGGSRGLGRAIALAFAAAGYRIILNYRENGEAAGAVAAAIRTHSQVHVVQADLSGPDGARLLAAEATQAFGRIDVLVNNAGALTLPAAWQEMTEESFHKTMATNLGSALFCCQVFAPTLAAGSAIINISSTYGLSGAGAVAAYTAAKAGLIALTKGLARDLAPTVRVNAVVPEPPWDSWRLHFLEVWNPWRRRRPSSSGIRPSCVNGRSGWSRKPSRRTGASATASCLG